MYRSHSSSAKGKDMISISGPAPGFHRRPNHQIRVRESHDHWQARSDDLLVADSQAVRILEETGYGAVVYFPANDVAAGALIPSKSETTCPFKGSARYFTMAATPSGTDIAWTYPATYDETKQIEGYVAFYADKVSIKNISNEQPKGNQNG